MKHNLASEFVSGFALACLLALGCAGGGATRDAVPEPKQHVEAPRQAGGVQAISGEVLGVDRVPVSDQNSLTLRLRIAPGAQDIVKVDLGPGWYFDEKGITFVPNEQVVVRGSHNDADGTQTLIASEIEKAGEVYLRDPADPTQGWRKQGEADGSTAPASASDPEPAATAQPEAPDAQP